MGISYDGTGSTTSDLEIRLLSDDGVLSDKIDTTQTFDPAKRAVYLVIDVDSVFTQNEHPTIFVTFTTYDVNMSDWVDEYFTLPYTTTDDAGHHYYSCTNKLFNKLRIYFTYSSVDSGTMTYTSSPSALI